MTVSATTLGMMGNTGGATSYGVALSRAPAANTLVLVDILNTDTGGTISLPTSVTGAGLVFSLVTSGLSFAQFTAGSQAAILSVWRGMGASPDGSRITCTGMGSGSNTGCAMIVTEYSGVSTSGTSGANAVGQSSTDSTTAATSLLVDAGPTSAASDTNAWHCALAQAAASGATADRYTMLGIGTYGGPSMVLASAYTTASSATTLQWDMGASGQATAVLVEVVAEVVAAAGGAVPSPYYASYYYPKVVAA